MSPQLVVSCGDDDINNVEDKYNVNDNRDTDVDNNEVDDDSNEDEGDGDKDGGDDDIERRSLQLKKREKKVKVNSKNRQINAIDEKTSTDTQVGASRSKTDKCIQISKIQGISLKGVDKFALRNKNSWTSKNLYMFYHLSIWRERTAAQYDRRASYALPLHLLLQLSKHLPMTLDDISLLVSPLPGILGENLEFFDDGRHVKGVELLLASILQGIQDYNKALEKLFVKS